MSPGKKTVIPGIAREVMARNKMRIKREDFMPFS
jgi:hypothetical protein